jgi:hypothetical protein
VEALRKGYDDAPLATELERQMVAIPAVRQAVRPGPEAVRSLALGSGQIMYSLQPK